MGSMEDKDGVRVVEQAAAVLYQFTPESPALGARDLARQLGISKSTVQRVLVSLHRAGMLSFDEATQKYGIGAGILRVAGPFLNNNDLIEAARPSMEQLREASGETVTLSECLEGARVTIFQLESPHQLRFTTNIRHRYPLVSGATSRVLLAYMPQEERAATVKALAADETAHRRIDYDAFMVALDETREEGFAMSFGEWVEGGAGAAVPVLRNSQLVAALSLYGPATRLHEGRIRELLPSMWSAAEEIANRVRG